MGLVTPVLLSPQDMPLPTSAYMDYSPRSYAEKILAGAAEVEDGFVRNATVEDSGKESVLPVVDVLDEVLGILPALREVLKSHRR